MTTIDCHAHFDPRLLTMDGFIAKMDAAGVERVALIPALNDPLPETPETLLAVMRRMMRNKHTRALAEGIHRTTLDGDGNLRFPKLPLPETVALYPQPDNDRVADALAAYPDRLLGWIFLNPARDVGVLDTLERYRSIKGFIGVKLHPHWHDYKTAILSPLLRRCEELGLPVLIHLGFRRRGDFRSIASSFPRLRIIAAHAGFPFYDDLWAYKNAYPNLHVDLSSPYIDEALARDAVAAMGPERCLYGTDAPYGAHEEDGSYDYGAIRGWIERLPVSSKERERVLGENFLRLIDPTL